MPTLTAKDLKPADVLLVQGSGLFSRFIRLFDGGRYSHAAIWDGAKVIEMECHQGDGLEQNDLAHTVGGANFVHCYRYISSDRHQLGDQNYPPEPILAEVANYVKQSPAYGYSQVMLLGLLLAAREIPNPAMAIILRHILDEAAEWVQRVLSGNKAPLICSELVYNCYLKAPLDEKYGLAVRGWNPAVVQTYLPPRTTALPAATIDSAAADLHREAASFLASYMLFKGKAPASSALTKDQTGNSCHAVVGDTGFAIGDFVTPRDLESSPNLQFMGPVAA